MNPFPSLSEPSRLLITVAAAIVVLAGVKAAAPFLGPLAFSVFLALIFGMLLHWFERKGLSARSALILTLAIFFMIIAVFIVVIAGSFFRLLSDIPRYQSELESFLGLISPLLSAVGIDPTSLTFSELINSLPFDVSSLLGGLWDVAVISISIILTTLFLLFEAKGFSSKLHLVIEELRPGDLHHFTTLAQKNVDYLIIRTQVNLAMGIGTAIILALIGVQYAVFWGFLAFLLGFVPYIGFWLAVVPPTLLALFDLGPVAAFLVLAGCGLVNILAEYLMFPHLAGRGLELSAAVVFISLLFWGWILGGIGVLLAVPLTLFVQLVCALFDETRWIAVLLGPSPGRSEKKGTK